LQRIEESPLGKSGQIDPDQLARSTGLAAVLPGAIQKIQKTIGADEGTVAEDVANATKELDLLLQRCQSTVEDWQTDLETAHEKQAFLEARVPTWLTLGSVGVTVLSVWFTFCQISLLVHAWKWFRGPT
jgi:hypothetical protein